jgi:hypothetical protein
VEEKKRGEKEPNRSPCKTRGIVVIKRCRHMKETIALPLCFPSHKKAHTTSFGSSNRYTTKAFEYSQVAKTSNFATAMARALKPLDTFLPPSPLWKVSH